MENPLYVYAYNDSNGPAFNIDRITLAEAQAQLDRLRAHGVPINCYTGDPEGTPLAENAAPDIKRRALMLHNSVSLDWENAPGTGEAPWETEWSGPAVLIFSPVDLAPYLDNDALQQ